MPDDHRLPNPYLPSPTPPRDPETAAAARELKAFAEFVARLDDPTPLIGPARRRSR